VLFVLLPYMFVFVIVMLLPYMFVIVIHCDRLRLASQEAFCVDPVQ
jgi:hypothetical protein